MILFVECHELRDLPGSLNRFGYVGALIIGHGGVVTTMDQ